MEEIKKNTDELNEENSTSADEKKAGEQNIKIEAQAGRDVDEITVKDESSDKGNKEESSEKGKEKKDGNIEISNLSDLDNRRNLEAGRAEALQKHKKAQKKKLIKKIIKWIIIVIVIILIAIVGVKYAAFSKMQSMQDSSKTQTGTVERMDLADSISTTGTVQSKDVRTITSANTGVTISKVNYKVGDYVNAGDIIVEFSREDILESISQAEEDLAEARANVSLKDQYMYSDNNYDHVSNTYTSLQASNSTAQSLESLNEAKANLERACKEKSRVQEEYNTAVENLPLLQSEYDQANAYKDLFMSTSKQTTLNNDVFPNSGNNSISSVVYYLGYEYTLDEFNNYISDLSTKINTYKSTINSYDSNLRTCEKSIETAQETVNRSQLSYEASLLSESDRNNSANKNNNTSDYNYDSYLITRYDSVTKAERTLKEQQDKLDDYIVYAPISGLVTSVSAQEGNGYVNTSGGLMTIQAVDTYEITTQIDEYDINSVQLGQRVVIMTDATGDDELEGTISFISPVATSSSSGSSATGQSSSSGNTYEVRIDINSDDARVKLGMSAKINIIIDQHKNILAVPYDAVEETDDGQYYVMVVAGNTNKPSSDKLPSSSANDSITVVGTDGTVTGTPSSSSDFEGMPDGTDFPSDMKPGGSDSMFKQFLSYLFSSDSEKGPTDTGLSSAGKKVFVNVGIEGDYYTEISADDISEGSTVILNTDSKDDNNDMMFMMNGGGGMGGGPGGF